MSTRSQSHLHLDCAIRAFLCQGAHPRGSRSTAGGATKRPARLQNRSVELADPDGAHDDLAAFTGKFAERYFRTCRDGVAAAAPNQLYLGCRFQAHNYSPVIVAAHWFQYGDETTTGRGDGENAQVGLVDVCDTPYAELVRASREVGYSMYEYRLGGAKQKEDDSP